jgi:hypothetical protein
MDGAAVGNGNAQSSNIINFISATFELLQRAAKPFCASGSNCRIRGIGSWHCCPAAPLDDQPSVPSRGLVELRQLRRRIGLLLESLGADRCKHVDHRNLCSLFRHPLRSTAECPSENGEPSTDMTIAPITAPQIPGFKLGGNFKDLMSCAPVGAPCPSYRYYHIPEISALLVPQTIRATTYGTSGYGSTDIRGIPVDAYSLTKASASNSRQPRQTDDRRVPKRGLVDRVRRFCGQVDAIERALDGEASCSDILQRITAARGAEHVREYLLPPNVRIRLGPAQSLVRTFPSGSDRRARASWDPDLLRNELGELDFAGFDLGLIGFEAVQLKTILGDLGSSGLMDPDSVPQVPDRPARGILSEHPWGLRHAGNRG